MKHPSKNQVAKVKLNATLNNQMRDYSKDPYFVRKDEEADAFLRKHGFPEELLRIKKERL